MLYISWYGSLKDHGTIGDLYALEVLSSFLISNDFNFKHITANKSYKISGERVELEGLEPSDTDVLIFVCGPVVKGHAILANLIEKFDQAHRVGVSVSILSQKNKFYIQPFSKVFSRENNQTNYFDLAILGPHQPLSIKDDSNLIAIGIVLNEAQYEYGLENSMHNEVKTLIDNTLQELALNLNIRVIKINHRLSQLSSDEIFAIEKKYQSCDVIITSRFHGAIFSIRNKIPFIAIDPIAKGAKVTNLLKNINWPYIYNIDNLNQSLLISGLKEILSLDSPPKLIEIIKNLEKVASRTLSALKDYLLSI